MKEGSRVGAILSGDAVNIYFLGYGIYLSDVLLPEDVKGFWAKLCRAGKHKNPKIQLDNGKVVWGCQCWWGDEEKVRTMLKDDKRKVIKVDISKLED